MGGETHRARFVVVNGNTVIENGAVTVSSGRIRSVFPWKGRCEGAVIDHGEVSLFPGLINPHTHLELSALGGRLDPGKGFHLWVQDLIATRDALGETALVAGIQDGIASLLATGTVAAGDISTLGLASSLFQESGLGGWCFHEYLGSGTPDVVLKPQRKGRAKIALAGHAPHTTAPSVLQTLLQKSQEQGTPFSLHLAESETESAFIAGRNPAWEGFLQTRGIDTDSWPIPSVSPVSYADALGLLSDATLAVHLIDADTSDFYRMKKRGTKICLCPRSNQALHGRLPDLYAMLQAGLAPALGTDSLASCPSLDLRDEMAFTAATWPAVSPAIIFSMATTHGAAALGISGEYGELSPGKRARFMKVLTRSMDPVSEMVWERPSLFPVEENGGREYPGQGGIKGEGP